MLAFCTWGGVTTGCGGSGPASLNTSASSQQGVVYYLTDHLGSANLVTDSNGTVLREEQRYPYGLDRKTEGTAKADYVYTGKELDEETGLIYFGARYYAPELGRWASPDPLFVENVEQLLKLPHEGNLYTYGANNPETFIDTAGSFAIIFTAPAIVAGSIIAVKALALGVAYVGSRLAAYGASAVKANPAENSQQVAQVNDAFDFIAHVDIAESALVTSAAISPVAVASTVVGGVANGYYRYQKSPQIDAKFMRSVAYGSTAGTLASTASTPLAKVLLGAGTSFAGNLVQQAWVDGEEELNWKHAGIAGAVGAVNGTLGTVSQQYNPLNGKACYDVIETTILDTTAAMTETQLTK